MSLTAEQKQKVAAWIEGGTKPAEVQARLEKEFDVRLTYMEVRFLIDDLKVMPKDPTPVEPPKPEEPEALPEAEGATFDLDAEDAAASGGKVAVQVDNITRPGAMVSGSVTFSDGKKSDWYLDQYGRLGMVPGEPGYRPPQSDLMEFQMTLEKQLVKLGL
jgi:hypothetical protein